MREPRGAECQCSACGLIFTSLSGFDLHQWWRGRDDEAQLICLDPKDLGMHQAERVGGPAWALPPNGGKAASQKLRKAVIAALSQQERTQKAS